MIIEFASKQTEKIWQGEVSRKLPSDIQQVALRKLFMLDKAQVLNDSRVQI
jgi:proteic killer suppression protein